MRYDGYIIYTDLDQTLVGCDGKISERNLQKIKYFQENGGMFSVATGRTAKHLELFSMKVNAPLICLNGTLIYDLKKDKILLRFPMDKAHAEVIEFAKEKFKDEFERILMFSLKESRNCIYDDSCLHEAFDEVFKNVFALKDENTALNLKKCLEENFGGKYAFERSWPCGVEMRLKESGKGACVEYVRSLYKDRRIVCAGDFENDITMIKAADVGVAVENALLCIKEAADVIAPNHCNDAIAWIIDNIEKF